MSKKDFSKVKKELNHMEIANKVFNSSSEKLIRFFRVYHPIYEASVNLYSYVESDDYHIIEKYMDMLICGYSSDERRVNVIDPIIKDEHELYRLLGLDNEAYEIAKTFFEDLRNSGHFTVTDYGIIGNQPALESIKLDKKVSSSVACKKLLFDQFTNRLLPKAFHDLQRYAVPYVEHGKPSDLETHTIWLDSDADSTYDEAAINNLINDYNSEYVGQARIDYGLPTGYFRMELKQDEKLTVSGIPYYLGVFECDGKLIKKAFRPDNGELLPEITDHYSKAAEARIDTISKSKVSSKDLYNPLCKSFLLTQNGTASEENGVYDDEETGNYIWIVTDKQIDYLIGEEENGKLHARLSKIVAYNKIACLTSFEAGHIVSISLSDERRNRIEQALHPPKQKHTENSEDELTGSTVKTTDE